MVIVVGIVVAVRIVLVVPVNGNLKTIKIVGINIVLGYYVARFD